MNYIHIGALSIAQIIYPQCSIYKSNYMNMIYYIICYYKHYIHSNKISQSNKYRTTYSLTLKLNQMGRVGSVLGDKVYLRFLSLMLLLLIRQ